MQKFWIRKAEKNVRISVIFCFLVFVLSSVNAQVQPSGGKALVKVRSLIRDYDSTYKKEPELAKALILQALTTSKSNGFSREYADSYFRLGNLMFDIGTYDSARYCLEQALAEYQSLKDTEQVAFCYKSLGNVDMESGAMESGFDYYTKGLELARNNHFDELEVLFINNIGVLYQIQGHYDEAFEHFQKCASIWEKGDKYAICMYNMGVVREKQENYDEAIYYYRQSLKACEEVNDEFCALTPLGGLAGAYLYKEDADHSLEYNEKIIKIQEKLGLDKELFVSYNRMGLIYNQMGKFEEALAYYNKSLAIGLQIRSNLVPYVHSNLSDVYANKGDYKEALNHTVQFYEMKDSIYNLDYKVKTEELLTKYEAENKEKEIALLKKDRRLREIEVEKQQALYTEELLKKILEEEKSKYKLLHKNREIGLLKKDKELQQAKIINKQNELDRQTLIRNVAIIGAILIFIPTFILMIVYQQKVRNKELLAAKTEEVNKQKTLELLRSFEIKTIKANIEGQEKEKQRVAKELHDGVAGTLAGIKMKFQSLGNLLEENLQVKNLMNSIDDLYKEVRTISHHLTPPGMLQYSFVDFIKKYLNEISGMGNLEVEYVFHGERQLNLLSDDVKVEVYRILQELIGNVIKHACADWVEVQVVRNDDGLNMIVEDRGKGFDASAKSAGLGLTSIRSRIDALGGQLLIDSVLKRGTIVSIDIPLV